MGCLGGSIASFASMLVAISNRIFASALSNALLRRFLEEQPRLFSTPLILVFYSCILLMMAMHLWCFAAYHPWLGCTVSVLWPLFFTFIVWNGYSKACLVQALHNSEVTSDNNNVHPEKSEWVCTPMKPSI